MKCQMHWQHPSSIYIIWFGPSCRLGEHETQRDILERALGIMEAEFGANSHKVHCMAQHGASGGFVFITGFLGGFLRMIVYACVWLVTRGKGSWWLWHIMTSYDYLWLMTRYDLLWLVIVDSAPLICWFWDMMLLKQLFSVGILQVSASLVNLSLAYGALGDVKGQVPHRFLFASARWNTPEMDG